MNDLTETGRVRMQVRALLVDPVTQMPVVILHDQGSSSYLPIWIGLAEANSIALELEGVHTPRPMTHDLVQSLLAALGARVDRVFIHTLAESVFIASLFLLDCQGTEREVDARPSDALAIALRTGAPIWVSHGVLESANVVEADEDEALRQVLERLRPEDLGEYQM